MMLFVFDDDDYGKQVAFFTSRKVEALEELTWVCMYVCMQSLFLLILSNEAKHKHKVRVCKVSCCYCWLVGWFGLVLFGCRTMGLISTRSWGRWRCLSACVEASTAEEVVGIGIVSAWVCLFVSSPLLPCLLACFLLCFLASFLGFCSVVLRKWLG